MPSTFAYWPTRGIVGHIRLIIRYVGEDCELKNYLPGKTVETNRENWLKDKYNLGLLLPNLPYYIDGDIKITQSLAIERYLARKHNLEATTESDRIRQDNILYLAVDLQHGIIRLCYNPDYAKVKNDFLKAYAEWLKQLSDVLGDCEYFIGQKVNFVDFHVYEAISLLTILDPSSIDAFPNLQAFQARIENLPGVKEYLSSPVYVKESLAGPGAAFGHVQST